MGKWKFSQKTESGKWRTYTWDSKHHNVSERDFLGCDHDTGNIARDPWTAKELARRHTERETGERVTEIWVYDESGNLHHKEKR
jgi:hypothetical protein